MSREGARDQMSPSGALMDTPEAEFNARDYRPINSRDINHLKEMAEQSPRKRYRFCLHSSHEHFTQEMIICLHGFNYFQPHRHPIQRSESYHMIEGEMDVYLFNDTGECLDTIKLSASRKRSKEEDIYFMYRLSAPLYHLMIPRSEWTIYHEVLTGPWDRETVVEYAPFAPSEKDAGEIGKYIYRITGSTVEELTK
jgi:cupin fold WbuC family metalloprotein